MGIASPEDILEIADSDARAANALRDDLLAALFPYGTVPPSELLQTQVKIKLQALVAGLQLALGIDQASTGGWDILARSGLLREGSLIEFALARLAEEKLQRQLALSGYGSALAQLPVSLLGHENSRIAEMAKTLLQAEQLATDSRYLFERLAPEQLHPLCWRVVAAAHHEGDTAIAQNAQKLLDMHSADRDPAMVARKLVFFVGSDDHVPFADLRKSGLRLFIAYLAQQLLLPSDQLLRLFGEGSVAPSMLLLKALAIPDEDAAEILMALRGAEDHSMHRSLAEYYSQLDMIDVRAQIANWTQSAGASAR